MPTRLVSPHAQAQPSSHATVCVRPTVKQSVSYASALRSFTERQHPCVLCHHTHKLNPLACACALRLSTIPRMPVRCAPCCPRKSCSCVLPRPTCLHHTRAECSDGSAPFVAHRLHGCTNPRTQHTHKQYHEGRAAKFGGHLSSQCNSTAMSNH